MKAESSESGSVPWQGPPRAKFPLEERTLEYIRLRLRDVREARGLTAKEVAARAGVSRSTLSSIESGLSRPSISSLHSILEALRADVSEVWPSPLVVTKAGSLTLAPSDRFRLREIVLLTGARGCCLLLVRPSGGCRVGILAHLRVEASDWRILSELVDGETDLTMDWRSFTCSVGGETLLLCLKGINDLVLAGKLSEAYLPFWLASIRFGHIEGEMRDFMRSF